MFFTGESIPTVYRLLLLLHAHGYVLRDERRRRFCALASVQQEVVGEPYRLPSVPLTRKRN